MLKSFSPTLVFCLILCADFTYSQQIPDLRPTSGQMNFESITWTEGTDIKTNRLDEGWDKAMVLMGGKPYRFTWTKHNEQEDRYILQYALIPNYSSLSLEEVQNLDTWVTFATVINPNGDGTSSAASREWSGIIPCDASFSPHSTKAIYIRIVRFDKTNEQANHQFARPSYPMKIAHGGRPQVVTPSVFLSEKESQNPWPFSLPAKVNFTFNISTGTETLSVDEYRDIRWFTDLESGNFYKAHKIPIGSSGAGRVYNPSAEYSKKPVHYAIFRDLGCPMVNQYQTPAIVAVVIDMPAIKLKELPEPTNYLYDDRSLTGDLRCAFPNFSFFPLPRASELIQPFSGILDSTNSSSLNLGYNRIDLPSFYGESNYVEFEFNLTNKWQVMSPSNSSVFINVTATEGHSSVNDYPLDPFSSDYKVCIDNLGYFLPISSPKEKTYRLKSQLTAKVRATGGVFNSQYDIVQFDQKTIEVRSHDVKVIMNDPDNDVCMKKVIYRDQAINDNDSPLVDQVTGLTIEETYSWSPSAGILSGSNGLSPIISHEYILSQTDNTVVYTLTRDVVINQGQSDEKNFTVGKCIEVSAISGSTKSENKYFIMQTDRPELESDLKLESEDEFNFIIYPNPTSASEKKINLLIKDPSGEPSQNKVATLKIFDLNGQLELERYINTNSPMSIDLTPFPSGFKIVMIYLDGVLQTHRLIEVK